MKGDEQSGAMWFTPDGNPDWSPALEHLRRTSERMQRMIAHAGPCTLTSRRDYFVVLCKAMTSQQLSTKAAATIFSRFCDQFPARRPTPKRLLELMTANPDVFRPAGMSRQKSVYFKDLAEHFAAGQIPTRRLATMDDEAVIESLTRVKGIGRWTAEMFLIFTLNRPDVWPVDDLGLRKGAQLLFQLRKPPDLKKLIQLGEQFRPWRSIATWYLWRGISALEKEG